MHIIIYMYAYSYAKYTYSSCSMCYGVKIGHSYKTAKALVRFLLRFRILSFPARNMPLFPTVKHPFFAVKIPPLHTIENQPSRDTKN